MRKRFLSIFICICMIFAIQMPVGFAAETEVSPLAGFEQYYQGGEVIDTLVPHSTSHYPTVENAGVEVTTYVKEVTTEGKPVVMYVINTQTERIGTDSDAEIIQSLIDRDYIVQVYDFKNQEFSKTPQLEWYLQAILAEVNKRKLYTYGNTRLEDQIYVLPSGYNIERNVQYFNYEESAADGTLDFIVDIWNTDFRAAWGSRKITYPDGTTATVSDITATTIDDCVNTDGSPLDLNLYLDIMYPTNPENEVPVMCQASSSQSAGAALSIESRPYNSGFLFNGYAGVVYEHCYVPMARNDHYGYFTGNTHQSPFTLYYYTGVKTQTAAIRRVRYLANTESEKYKFDLDAFGAYGHSKASNVHMLGTPEPENQPEMYFYKGHYGESTGTQPWTTYEEGELAGQPIPSNTQMVYTSNGGGYDVYFDESHAPTFATCGESDGNGVAGFLAGVVNQSRALNVPCLHFSMPKLGHTQVAGYSPKFQADMYQSFFDFTDYWLKDANAVCSYIYPTNNTVDVPVDSTITVKFTAPVSETEINKAKVTETKTGSNVAGSWSADMANTTWIFTPDRLTGGTNYTITVPKSILAENGKELREGKTATIRTHYETAFESTAIAGQNGSLTMVQNGNSVYVSFDGQDFASSTTASLRLEVNNDAANTIAVYALDTIDTDDITLSEVGAQVGELQVAGEGYYDLDITELTKDLSANDTVGFMLQTEKTAEEIVLHDIDFETELPAGVTSGALSTEDSNGGSQSYKGRGFSSDKLLFPDGITEADYGRKFHISADVKLTTDRGLIARVEPKKTVLDTVDYNDTTRVNLRPGTESWTSVQLDYTVDDLMYCRSDVRKEILSIYTTGDTLSGDFSTDADLGRRAGNAEELYLDNLKITETVTDVELAGAQLVTHPAVTNNVAPSRAAYVESGNEKDTSFEGAQYLMVNGRKSGYYLDSTKKVYAKIDLSSYYANMPAKVTLQVSSGSGIVKVYGLDTDTDWSAETINYYNAPANDRLDGDVDLGKVYGGSSIAKAVITDSGEYTIDITDYAVAMKAQGKTEATLIFVLQTDSYDEREIVFEDFNDGAISVPLTVSGGRHANELTNEQSYNPDNSENAEETGGYAYMLISKEPGGRFVVNLLDYASIGENDIGRSFTLTYWMKAERAGTVRNAMIPWGEVGYNRNIYLTDQVVAEEDVGIWKQYTYDFSITEELLTNGQLCVNFQHQASGDFTAYYDDIKLTEHPRGDIRFDFAEGEVLDGGYLYKKNAWTTVGEAVGYRGTTSPDTSLSISATENHTSGSFDSTSLSLNGVSASGQFYFKQTLDADSAITSDMIGKTYDISFWIKSAAAGSFRVGMANGTDREGASNWAEVQSVSISSDEINTWKQVTYSVTITQELVDANRGYFGLYIYSAALGAAQLYIDDFVSKERVEADSDSTVSAPYTYAVSEWSLEENPTVHAKIKGISGWATKLTNSDAANHSPTGSTSASLNAIGTSGQLYFYKTLSEDNVITEDMVGKTYNISFWINSAASGTFKIGMSNYGAGGSDTTSNWEYATSVSIAASEVGTWKEVTLSVTVTDTMLEAQRSTLGFYVYSSALGAAQMYIDDFRVSEQIEFADDGRMTVFGADEKAAVDSMGTADVFGLDKNSDAAGVRKVYLEFIGENTNTQKAVLNINIDDAAGQKFGVYALADSSYPSYITYSNAPGSNADESMDLSSVYGGAALAEFTAESGGSYQVDVTEYVKNKADEQFIFAIATPESGGVRYYHQDFESFTLSEGADYTTDGSVTLNGEASVEGGKLQLLNVFGNDNKALTAEKTYVITARTTGDVSMALADLTGEVVADSVYAQNGIISLTYTASAEDAANGISTLIFTGEGGFSVDDVTVETESKIIVGGAELVIETADVEADTDAVTINVSVIGGVSVSVDGTDKGTSTTESVTAGTSLALSASGDGEFMYWIDNNSNTILSYDESYNFTAGSDRSIAAVYAGEADIFVTFTSMANKLVASGVSGSITTPAAPYVYGYSFHGWYANGEKAELTAGETVTAEVNTEFKAGFMKDSTTYTVTVNGVGETHTYNEKVTLTADAEKDGAAFSYWERDGEIVSYNTEYSFYVNGDTTVDAVYGESAEGGIILAMAAPVSVEGSKIAFFAERDISADCTVIETGILLGTSGGLTLENAPLKAVAKSTANKGQFTVRKANVTSGDTWYAVAYVIYRDANGNVLTEYSNEVSYTME